MSQFLTPLLQTANVLSTKQTTFSMGINIASKPAGRHSTADSHTRNWRPPTMYSSPRLSARHGLAAAAALLVTVGAQAAPVYAVSASPGDTFQNAGASNLGQAATAGWYYNNVRAGGQVGINTTYARDGNGSAYMGGPANAKADIEFLPSALQVSGNYGATASMGLFTSLSSMSYEWYRDASSTAAAHLHPSLRVLLDLDGNLQTLNDRGGLVFERAYNPSASAVPTDAWTLDQVGASSKLWNFGLGLGFEFDIDNDGTPYDTLAEWQANGRMANAVIIGFSSGIGSGWAGSYEGAVDNISWTIDGATTTSNFEVAGAAVPEPGSLALLGIGLAGLAAARRRKPA